MPIRIEQTPDGRRLCVSREVDAAAGAAWELLVDTVRWPQWGPSVTAVDCPTRRIEAGTRGRVQVGGGPWVPFEVTACDGTRWTWNVAGITATGHSVVDLSATENSVVDLSATEHSVTGRGHDRCRVIFEIPLLAGGYAPVCVRALDRIESLLAGDGE